MVGMADESGHFQFAQEVGPTGLHLVSWALVNDDGDVMAVSYAPLSSKSARRQTQWIIDHARDCTVVERVVRRSLG
jgi:hypothetical protein